MIDHIRGDFPKRLTRVTSALQCRTLSVNVSLTNNRTLVCVSGTNILESFSNSMSPVAYSRTGPSFREADRWSRISNRWRSRPSGKLFVALFQTVVPWT